MVFAYTEQHGIIIPSMTPAFKVQRNMEMSSRFSVPLRSVTVFLHNELLLAKK